MILMWRNSTAKSILKSSSKQIGMSYQSQYSVISLRMCIIFSTEFQTLPDQGGISVTRIKPSPSEHVPYIATSKQCVRKEGKEREGMARASGRTSESLSRKSLLHVRKTLPKK